MTITQRIALLVAVPVIAFVSFTSFFVWGKLKEAGAAKAMQSSIELIQSTSNFITQLQRERGKSMLFVNGAVGRAEIDEQRKQTDSSRVVFEGSLNRSQIGTETKHVAQKALSGLSQFRTGVDQRTHVSQVLKAYKEIIGNIISVQNAAAKADLGKGIAQRLANVSLFEEAKEYAGILRAAISAVLAANQPLSDEEFGAIVGYLSRIHAGIDSPALTISKETERQIGTFKQSSAWQEVESTFSKVAKNADKGQFGVDPKSYFTSATKQVDDIDSLIRKEIEHIEKTSSQMKDEAVSNIWWSLGLSLFIIAAIIAVSFVIGRGISQAVGKVALGLSESSEQIASASGQVASAGQQQAEGASEQAASIEETSSSLEEISSMTRLNAEHAAQANHLMKEAGQTVGLANESMDQLTVSMKDISKAGESISKIIKTIDEIAFQTNLLALNAAVEAARAGEAGAGFAVVADEVRNLALRAAEAAKNTSDLIESTVRKIKEGGEIVDRTRSEFSRTVSSVSKVGDLVGEITAASNEQAQGIEQINKAVSEMDKVVQQSAANAEESASASEELNAQALQMNVFVRELLAFAGVVGKSEINMVRDRVGASRSRVQGMASAGERMRPKAIEAGRQRAKGGMRRKGNGKEIKPKLPMPRTGVDLEGF